MYRYLIDWAADNKNILQIGDILSADETLATISVKYSSWHSTFTVPDDDIQNKDDVLNMLWRGYLTSSLPKLKNAVSALSALTGKKEYNKTIVGTLTKSGDTTITPNVTSTYTSDGYTDTTNNAAYTDQSETLNSSVAYNTLAEKEKEKSVSKNIIPAKNTSVNFGKRVEKNEETGSTTNTVNLSDSNNVSETGWETLPELIRDSIEYVNKQPVYDFIDRFVHQFFTI